MSHFPVAVIHDPTKPVENLLLPYKEFDEDTPYQEFLVFNDITEEYLGKYRNEKVPITYLPNGRMIIAFDDSFFKTRSDDLEEQYHFPVGTYSAYMKADEYYYSFDEYMDHYCGYEKDEYGTGTYGYYHNPYAKWDWYVIGGRWKDDLRFKCFSGDIGKGTSVPLDSVIFDRDEERAELADKQWRKYVDHEDLEDDDIWDPFGLRDPKEQYGDKSTFVRWQSDFVYRAVILPDGEWHEVGEMGWFGITSETPKELSCWVANFYEDFISHYLGQGYTITIVDCHI